MIGLLGLAWDVAVDLAWFAAAVVLSALAAHWLGGAVAAVLDEVGTYEFH